jgi:hypothetical protein
LNLNNCTAVQMQVMRQFESDFISTFADMYKVLSPLFCFTSYVLKRGRRVVRRHQCSNGTHGAPLYIVLERARRRWTQTGSLTMNSVTARMTSHTTEGTVDWTRPGRASVPSSTRATTTWQLIQVCSIGSQ